MSLLELFGDGDDCCQRFWQQSRAELSSRAGRKGRQPGLGESEIRTIVIHFQPSGYRNFKMYYINYVPKQLQGESPHLVSYSRFVGLLSRAVLLLWAYPLSRCRRCRGLSFVDSTALRVGHHRPISRNKVFAGLAERGQASSGCFSGFKRHRIVHEYGQRLAFLLTPGHVADRQPVPALATKLLGQLLGDKGSRSQAVFDQLGQTGVQLITPLKTKMKNRLRPWMDQRLLGKRYLIETINDPRQNHSQIEHSRQRRPVNFVVNGWAGLMAYSGQPKKPASNWSSHPAKTLALLQ